MSDHLKTRTISEVVLRILGVGLVVQAAVALPRVIGLISRLDQVELFSAKAAYVMTGVLPSAVLLACGVSLFLWSGWIERRFLTGEAILRRGTALEIQSTAFAVAGLVVFGIAIPGLAATGQLLITGEMALILEGRRPFPWSPIVGYGLQAAFGLVIFLQARRIAIWRSARDTSTSAHVGENRDA